jgi:negative regulator of flagellin synthesis FlgM
MTDAISHQARVAQSNTAVRNAIDKVDKKSGTVAQTPAEEAKLVREKAPAESDSVSLTNVDQKIKDQPDFDRAKVEAIKSALKDGNYPLNPRRIAENFVAIEQMIQG